MGKILTSCFLPFVIAFSYFFLPVLVCVSRRLDVSHEVNDALIRHEA
jgi:hypothetical protein